MIYLTSDHGGYQLKKSIASYLKNQLRVDFVDLGPDEYIQTDDFPDYALAGSKKVLENPENRGIFICWTGQGMCISANKVKGIRAVLGYSIDSAEWARLHNNANVLCLAGKVLTADHANAIVKKFLETKFDGDERLIRRDNKIKDIENNN